VAKKEWEMTLHSEIYALVGYYAAWSGNPSPTVPNNVSVPPTRVKKLPAFNESERYITVFITAHHLYITCLRGLGYIFILTIGLTKPGLANS
jgi:hypothetical protein